jgi:hypothetical protein
MAGTPLRNTQMFENLCGSGALQNVVLVTTMWGKVKEQAGAKREDELKTNFWQSMIASGSRLVRFGDTYESAWEILDQFTASPRAIQLQVEMVDERKPLAKTAAGRALFQFLSDLIEQFRDMITSFQERLRGRPRSSDPQFIEGLQSEALDTQHNLELAIEQKDMLSTEPAERPHRKLVARFVKGVKVLKVITPTRRDTSAPRPDLGTSSLPRGSIRTSRSYDSQTSTSPGLEKRGRKLAATQVVLKHTSHVAGMAPVGFLKGVLSMALGVAESIEVCSKHYVKVPYSN